MSLEGFPATQAVFYSASPPAAPVDGTLWVYPADATNGVNWTFRYRSGQTYPWECIGGSPWFGEVLTDELIGSPQTAYQETATPLRFTAPRAGLYLMSFGATMYSSGPTTFYISIGVGSSPSDNDCVQMQMDTNMTAVTGSRTIRRTYSASDIVQQRYKNSSAVATDVLRRWMTALPVAIS